jgi:hypothetical protein
MIQQDDENSQQQQDEISKNELHLEYGDIIEILAPRNRDIHENTFYITYIDDSIIKLTNVSTLLLHELSISEEGNITDESIEVIELLSRADEKGYARQNGLIPKKWIDVHFGGDFPLILTGEITNLEEDMIEITTYPDLNIIYIDFGYKGIPQDIPIQDIQIRKKPQQLEKVNTLASLHPSEMTEEKASMEMTDMGESIISIPEGAEPDKNIRDALHSLYIDANDIIFGDEEEEIEQVVEISEKEKRYTIEMQVNSLMDELLSTIPNSQRSKTVLDNIHRIITRFKELREKYSNFDDTGNIRGQKLMGPDYKPLVSHIQKMDVRLKWIIPVVQNKIKLYHPKFEDFSDEPMDAIINDYDTNLKDESDIQLDYLENRRNTDTAKYKEMMQRIHPYMTPFDNASSRSIHLQDIPILANIDAIVDNLENFESTILKHNQLSKRKYLIERYNLGDTTMEPEILKTGRRIYIRKNSNPNDTITLKSVITLPQSIMKYSKSELPSTNIMNRTSLAANPPLLFRILKRKLNIEQYIVDQFKKDVDYEKLEKDTNTQFLSTIKEYVLDETLNEEDNKLEKFLKVIIPNSRNLIRLIRPYIQDKLSVVEIANELEPFMVYIENITYDQYMEIRYFIKERIKERAKEFAQKAIDFSIIRTTPYKILPQLHGIERMIRDMKPFIDIFIDGYKFDYLRQTKPLRIEFDMQPSELLLKIMSYDNGQLLHNLISQDKLSLVIPENFINALELPKIGDMGQIEKIKANDCTRRFLVKRYSSLQDLQNDNHEEIWYDKEFDDTHYDLFKKYKSEQSKMSAEDFIDFLSENLIAKHECPINTAKEMAQTLILGKKRIQDGEYAILELRPKLPGYIDETTLSAKEKSAIELEGRRRILIHYYRRLKNNWVRDENVDETAFIDNNTLFCNINKICFKNISNAQCEPIKDAAERMKQIAKKKLIEEADDRYSKTLEEMKVEFENNTNYYMKMIMKQNILKTIHLYKANNYAYELGNFAETEDIIQSPYSSLRDFILSQDDFVKCQRDICRLVYQFTRQPMVDELNESPYWLYCKETNTKLIPNMLYILADAYVSGGDYQQEQDRLCRSQGIISDDGDAIVDKHSGYIIRKIDFSSEEGFDEAGFKMTTNEIMQKDLKTVIEESLKQKDKVFENETTQMVYNIFITLCENLGIPSDGMENLIIRLTVEIIEMNIKKEAAYEKFAEKMEKQKGKRPPAYIIYRNQTIILMTAAVLLIGLQTAAPPYKPKITAPGCIRSFSGFPLNGGDEDTSGLQYISCVVNKTKSSTPPWNSIKSMPQAIITKGIRQIITDMLIARPDISELYIKKREYILLNHEDTIPEEHSINKWRRFLPPVVSFTVVKSLHTISSEFKSEFIELMRKGNKDQRESLTMIKSKLLLYGYGVIERINDTVSKKDLLLKTSANVPFLQNACCGDRKTNNSLDYFIEEEPEIDQYLKIMTNLSEIVINTKELTQASVFFHPINNAIVRPIMPTVHFDTNIYATIIYYCRFDRNIPVPEEFRKICNERPAGYNSSWSLEEKIKFLRENGKRFTIEQLHQLMEIVYNKNRIQSTIQKPFSKIETMREILEFLDEKNSSVIDNKLISHLLNVIYEHNPTQYLKEDSEHMESLKNYLAVSNRRMYETIYEFLDKHGNMKASHLEHIDDFLSNITSWSFDRTVDKIQEEGYYSIVQFINNAVFSMSKIFPEIILNNIDLALVPKHWNLSQFHQQDVSRFIRKYYEPLNKFKNDKVLTKLLRTVQGQLTDLNILIQNIPIYTQINKGENTFYSLFDKKTVYLLLKYLWYSVLYEYIMLTDDPDLLQLDIEENKSIRRAQIRNKSDFIETIQTVQLASADPNEVNTEYIDDLNDLEISIHAGNKQDLKRRTAQLIITFLDIDLENKKSINLNYMQISEKMNRSKQSEKKLITDFFRDMETDERRVKNLEKTYKMGRWNVGMQKGLVQYDKTTYDRERGEIIERLNNTVEVDDDVAIMERDIYEIEQDDEVAIAEEYDGEGADISGFGEDYQDGDYYGDDNRDDDFGREE